MTINALFSGAVLENGIIKIPKTALPGLSNPATVTAGQFFACVLVRGIDHFPSVPAWPDNHKVVINHANVYYPDFGLKRPVGMFRTQVNFLTTNLESL